MTFMLRISNAMGCSFSKPQRIRHSLLLLLALSLLSAGPLAAQEDQEAKKAAADKLYSEAVQLQHLGTKESLQQALSKFLEVIPLCSAAGVKQCEAAALGNVGHIYNTLGDQEKALEYDNQALRLLLALGDGRNSGTTLNNIGAVYADLSEWQKALEYYNQALLLRHEVGDGDGEGETLNNLGSVYSSLGDQQKALDYSSQALTVFRETANRIGEATTLTWIGRVYSDTDQHEKALDCYRNASLIFHEVGDLRGEANTLSGIGTVYADLGEEEKALDQYEQALRIRKAVGDLRGEARVLHNIGLVNFSLGDYQKALDYYGQALPISQAAGDRKGEAAMFSGIGTVYLRVGEKQKALDYYEQALTIFHATGERFGEANALNAIGAVYANLEEEQKALDHFTQALPLFSAVANRRGGAATLGNIGAVYAAVGQPQKALDYLERALPFHRAAEDRRGEASTLTNIGTMYSKLGQRQKALDYYGQALPIRSAIGDRDGEATTLFNIADVERARGNFTESLTRIEAALSIVESLRIRIANQELRSSYFATVQDYYELYIDLLMRLHKQQPTAGYDGNALQASERGRARSLLETLAEANADIRQGVDTTLLARERTLQQQLNGNAKQQTQLLSGQHTEAQADTIAQEIERLTTELQQVEAQIRLTSPHYAALTQPQPLTLPEIQTQVLDADTVLLEYSLGTDRSYLWAVTPDSITSYELPKRSEIEEVARQVYALLNNSTPWSSGQGRGQRGAQVIGKAKSIESPARLSQMVLAPAAALLGQKRLLIVADGALQYIPFGALPVPSTGAKKTKTYQPLIVGHEVVSLPSASTLAVLRREVKDRQPAAKEMAAFGDPVFASNDERIKSRAERTGITANGSAQSLKENREMPLVLKSSARQSGVRDAASGLPRLPGTRREAEKIVLLVSPTARELALDFAANRQTATATDLGQYRFVHFATHGFLNSQHPELSGIALSMFDKQGNPQDGFLRMHEVFNLKLGADMVVLSACQTGLGKEIRGEGLVGLTRGFMYAGAPRVVVSLWSVNDESTAELMTRFYKGILVDKLRPAKALQAAQVSMFKDKRYSAPFYWAAFTLQGEWK
jgi:CHAT domain-containing protein/tetratricopeptide (TPR) repeat protein